MGRILKTILFLFFSSSVCAQDVTIGKDYYSNMICAFVNDSLIQSKAFRILTYGYKYSLMKQNVSKNTDVSKNVFKNELFVQSKEKETNKSKGILKLDDFEVNMPILKVATPNIGEFVFGIVSNFVFYHNQLTTSLVVSGNIHLQLNRNNYFSSFKRNQEQNPPMLHNLTFKESLADIKLAELFKCVFFKRVYP